METDANMILIIRIMTDGFINSLGLILLVYYSLHRKFKNEKPKTLWDRIDRWRVEIIIAAVLVPQWADWITRLLD